MKTGKLNAACVRSHFWAAHTEFSRVRGRHHNDYNATIRTAFCDYVDSLRRNNLITERTASNVTL